MKLWVCLSELFLKLTNKSLQLGIVFEKIKNKYGKPNVGNSGPNGFLQKRGGIFYDLGSGTGKPLIAAAVLHNFGYCYGIEILEGLYTTSLEIQSSYASKVSFSWR